ncbi:hypothetical protein LSAT2_029437 [Lamellibrachia satsuma]|nr:hypothetical protein LSAT2_029437 [Lamellibrachia satsuma]
MWQYPKVARRGVEIADAFVKLQLLQSWTKAEHDKILHNMMAMAQRHVLVYNLQKCDIKKLSMKFFGVQGEGWVKERKTGLVYSCEFVKKRNDTVLRVVWNGDLRLIHTGPKSCSCRRWFFTINGGECSEPRTIETQLYINTRGTNIHRPAYVEGYCRGVSAGHLNVGWNVGDCQNMNAYNVGDSSTGYKATVRIIVEEVDVEDANTVIV